MPLVQDHTASKQWSQESKPGALTVSSVVNTHEPLVHTHREPTTHLHPTAALRAQGPFSFRPGCSGNTVRTAFRSRPTSLGELRAPSHLATTPGTPRPPLPPVPHSFPGQGGPGTVDWSGVGSWGAPRAAPPEVLTAGGIWLWERAAPPKAVMANARCPGCQPGCVGRV